MRHSWRQQNRLEGLSGAAVSERRDDIYSALTDSREFYVAEGLDDGIGEVNSLEGSGAIF